MQNHVVGTLDLAVSSRVGYCRLVHTDVMPVTEVQELFAGELGAVVGDDDVGYPEPVVNVGEENVGLLGADVCDASSLNPFGEFVDGHQQMGISPVAFCRGPTRSRPHTTNGHVMGIIWSA